MIGKLNKELDGVFEKQELGKGGSLAKKCRGGRLRKKAFGGQLGMTIAQALSGMPQGYGQGIQTAATGLGAFNPGGLGSSQFSTPAIGNTQGFFGGINKFLNNPLVGQIGRGLGDVAYAGASFAPGLYNLSQGLKPAEQINYADYRNPEYNRAVSLMADRRYDPSSELEAVEESDAVYRQGLRNIGSQSSGTLHNRLSSAASRRLRGRSGVFNRAQNINLGLQGEEAQFRAGLGAQDAATRFNVDDINAQNRAARRNFLGQSMTNLQQVAMQNRLMRNQRQRDDRLFNLAQSMSPQYGYGDDYSLRFRGYGS
jgi:hypothetical protein